MSIVVLQSWLDAPPKIRGIHTDKNDDLVYVPDHLGQFVAQEVSNKSQKVKRSVIIPGRKKGEYHNNNNTSTSNSGCESNKSKSDTSKNVIVKGEEEEESEDHHQNSNNNADDDDDDAVDHHNNSDDEENNGSNNKSAVSNTVISTSFKLDDKYASNPCINTYNQHHKSKLLQQQQHKFSKSTQLQSRRINEGRKPTVKAKPLLLRSVSTSPEHDLMGDLDSTPPSSPVSNGRYRNLGPELSACIPKRQLKFGINWMREGSSSSLNDRRSLNNSTPSLSTLQDFYSSEGEDKISSCFSSSQCSSTTPSPQPTKSVSLSNFSKSSPPRHQPQSQEEYKGEETEVRTKERQGETTTRPISITSTSTNSNTVIGSTQGKGKTAPVPAALLEHSLSSISSSLSKLSKEKVTESSRLIHESTTSSSSSLSSLSSSPLYGNERSRVKRQQLSPPPPPPPPSSTSTTTRKTTVQPDYNRELGLTQVVETDVDFVVVSHNNNNNHNHQIQLESNLTTSKEPLPSPSSSSRIDNGHENDESGGEEEEGTTKVHKSDVILVEVIRKKLTNSSASPSVSGSSASECGSASGSSVSSCGSDLESEYLDTPKKRPPQLILPNSNTTNNNNHHSKGKSFSKKVSSTETTTVVAPVKRNSFGSEVNLGSLSASLSSGRKSVDFSDHLEYIEDNHHHSDYKKTNCESSLPLKSICRKEEGNSKKDKNKNIIYTSSRTQLANANGNDEETTIFTSVCSPLQQSDDLTTTTVVTTTKTVKGTFKDEPQVEQSKGESPLSSSSNLFVVNNNKNLGENKIKDPTCTQKDDNDNVANLKGTKDNDSCCPTEDNKVKLLEQQQQQKKRDDDGVRSERDPKAVIVIDNFVDQGVKVEVGGEGGGKDVDNFGGIVAVATVEKEPPVVACFAPGDSTQLIQTLQVVVVEEPSPNPPSPHSATDSLAGQDHNESRIGKKKKKCKDPHNSRKGDSTCCGCLEEEGDRTVEEENWRKDVDQCHGSVSNEAVRRQCQRPRNECQDEEEILTEQDDDDQKSDSSSEEVNQVHGLKTTQKSGVKDLHRDSDRDSEEDGKGKLDSEVRESVNKVSSLLLTQVEQKTEIQKSQSTQHHHHPHHQESHAQKDQSQSQSTESSVSGEEEEEENNNNKNNSHSVLFIPPSSTPVLSMDRGKIQHQGPSPIASVKIPVQAVNKHVHRSDSSDEFEGDVIWRNSSVRENFRGFCQQLLESSSNGSQSEDGNEKIIIHVPQPQISQKQPHVEQPQNNSMVSSTHQNDGVIEFEDDEIYDEEEDRCSTELSSDRETPIHHQQSNNSIEYISVLDNVQVTGAQSTVTNKNDGHYNVHPKPLKWIISLDLGSRTSGFSYWAFCDPDVVHIGSWSGDGCTHKIPSWILTTMENNNKSATAAMSVKVGQEALDEYTENRSSPNTKPGSGSSPSSSNFVSQWREFYEMNSESARLTFPYTLESIDDDLDFGQLVTALIHFFGRAALTQIHTKFASFFDKTEKIEWVITVPSCWSSESRQSIREAAFKSGVVKVEDGVNLIEDSIAACIFAAMCGPRNNFLALDIGGAFLHYGGFVLKHGALHQTLQGKSCPLPTPEIKFENLLTQIVSREFILYYKAKYRPGWIELIKNFEKAKCKFDSSGVASTSCAFVFLPSSFVVEFNFYTGLELSECLQEQNSGITWNENGALSIPPNEMKLILKPTLDFVINKIESILSKHDYEHLVLTGGFAKSRFLKESISAKFPELLNLVMPKEFANGVLQGSTLSLMPNIQPKLIIKSPFSIGVGVMTPFDDILHPEEKKIVKDAKTWCADFFDELITYGQEMELGSIVNKRSYVGAQPGQSCLVLPLFKSSQSQVPKLVTDKSVQKCCELRFSSRKKWQEIDLLLSCRASELVIQAVDPLSMNIVHRVVIDLL